MKRLLKLLNPGTAAAERQRKDLYTGSKPFLPRNCCPDTVTHSRDSAENVIRDVQTRHQRTITACFSFHLISFSATFSWQHRMCIFHHLILTLHEDKEQCKKPCDRLPWKQCAACIQWLYITTRIVTMHLDSETFFKYCWLKLAKLKVIWFYEPLPEEVSCFDSYVVYREC